MRDLVDRHDIREGFLRGGAEAGAFLRLWGKKRECGEVQQAGPTLAERSGNLRNRKARERKRAVVFFEESDRGIDFTRQ